MLILPHVQVAQLESLHNGEDYHSPFCRRLGGPPKDGSYEDDNVNSPKCFVTKDTKENGGKNLDVPRISNCWVVPCTIKISNECYKQYWRNRRQSGGK